MSLKYSNKESGFIIPIAVGCIGAIVAILVIALIIISVGANMFSGKKGSGSGSGSGTWAGSTTTASLPTSVLAQISINRSTYVLAAEANDIEWQVLAAVHYREGTNDPMKSGPSGEMPGTVNPDSGVIECYTFQECEIVRGQKLKSLASGVYSVNLARESTEEELKLAFLAYNRGYMYKNGGCTYDESPYVMNQFNDSYKNMTWPNNECEPPSVRGLENIPNGAFTVFVLLKQLGT